MEDVKKSDIYGSVSSVLKVVVILFMFPFSLFHASFCLKSVMKLLLDAISLCTFFFYRYDKFMHIKQSASVDFVSW